MIPTQIDALAVSSSVAQPGDHFFEEYTPPLLMLFHDKQPDGVDVPENEVCDPVMKELL
jgi:hypothetical protein